MLDRSWQRPALTTRQVRADVALGVTAALVSVANVEIYRSGYGADLGWRGLEAYVLFALAGLVLALRRVAPLNSLVAESAIFILVGERLGLLGATFPIQIVLFVSLYSAWAWSNRPRMLVVTSLAVVTAMFVWLLLALLEPSPLPDPGGLLPAEASRMAYSLAINIVYFGGAMAWGHVAWRGARERESARERAELQQALTEERRLQSLRAERVRIARDLHDVVAHHVSSIGVQAAGAARVLERDPTLARGALGTIESSARDAVRQMHELVHLLRSDDAGDRSPQPGLDDLATLADCAGPEQIDYRVVGQPYDVPPTAAASLFRIGQESVANVRRHARAQRVSIVLRYLTGPRAVELEVVDDGRGATPSARTLPETSPRTPRVTPHETGVAGESGGFGLPGIRERVALHGGTSEIGPRPQGGFRVRVRLPVPNGPESGSTEREESS